MSIGVVVVDLMEVADVGSLWAEAERWGPVVTGKRRGGNSRGGVFGESR